MQLAELIAVSTKEVHSTNTNHSEHLLKDTHTKMQDGDNSDEANRTVKEVYKPTVKEVYKPTVKEVYKPSVKEGDKPNVKEVYKPTVGQSPRSGLCHSNSVVVSVVG